MNLLEYTFFQHALAGSLLASILCGLIGTYIVTRRLVFISGGITHASFGGIGLGVFILCFLLPYLLCFQPVESNGSVTDVTCVRTRLLPFSGH